MTSVKGSLVRCKSCTYESLVSRVPLTILPFDSRSLGQFNSITCRVNLGEIVWCDSVLWIRVINLSFMLVAPSAVKVADPKCCKYHQRYFAWIQLKHIETFDLRTLIFPARRHSECQVEYCLCLTVTLGMTEEELQRCRQERYHAISTKGVTLGISSCIYIVYRCLSCILYDVCFEYFFHQNDPQRRYHTFSINLISTWFWYFHLILVQTEIWDFIPGERTTTESLVPSSTFARSEAARSAEKHIELHQALKTKTWSSTGIEISNKMTPISSNIIQYPTISMTVGNSEWTGGSRQESSASPTSLSDLLDESAGCFFSCF